jgi:hypothetical protein
VNEFWAAIAGALVGSIAGGIVSLLLQLSASKQAREDRAQEKLARNKVVGAGLLTKTVLMHGNLKSFTSYLDEVQTPDPRTGAAREFWQNVRPLANSPRAVAFETEELALSMGLGVPDLLARLQKLDHTHAAAADQIMAISQRRAELDALLPLAFDSDGRASVVLDDQQLFRVRPRMVDINLLAAQMIEKLYDDEREGFQLLRDLDEALRTKLAWGLRLDLPDQKAQVS